MSVDNELGPLLRRWGLSAQQLPAATAGPDELRPFVAAILGEALPFIDSAAPRNSTAQELWKSRGARSSPDSAAKIEVLERRVSAKALRAVAAAYGIKTTGAEEAEEETWAVRRSVHEDAARPGTASWAEFERAFRLDHAKTEMAFTPNVVGAHEAQRWDCAGIEAVEEAGQAWDRFSLVVEEMRHRVGRPVLKDRTFPVLQLSCAAKEGAAEEFVIVSIPVPDFATSEKAKLSKEKGALIAYYVSVERIRKLNDGKIEWLLGTASDAAGVLPLWIQDKALLGIVWKDVPLFLGWIARERGKGKEKAGAGAEAGAEATTNNAAAAPVESDADAKKGDGEEKTPRTGAGTAIGEAAGPTVIVSDGDAAGETETVPPNEPTTPEVTTGVETGEAGETAAAKEPKGKAPAG
ncbi:hypothetical protein F4802DRAFT_546960 [Xylaria palmicola]|nr:hypothetical protein F4802DRAFT_546960 [Xylaria palmicola]